MSESSIDQTVTETQTDANHRLDRILSGTLTFGLGGLMLVFGGLGFWFWAHGGSIDIGPSSPAPAIGVSILGLVVIVVGTVVVRR